MYLREGKTIIDPDGKRINFPTVNTAKKASHAIQTKDADDYKAAGPLGLGQGRLRVLK